MLGSLFVSAAALEIMFPSNFLFLIFVCSLLNVIPSDCTAPKLEDVHLSKSLNVETKFKVFCNLQEGTRPFLIKWFKNGQLLSDSSDSLKIESDDLGTELSIYKVQPSDSGNYTCKVSNPDGLDSKYTLLTVKGLII